MATLHGSWSPQESELFIWGEVWQAGTAIGTAYPYGLDRDAMVALLESLGLEAEVVVATWQMRELQLPSQDGKPLLSGIDITDRERDTEIAVTNGRKGARRQQATAKDPQPGADAAGIALQLWQVEGCGLPLARVLQLLPALPLSDWETGSSAIGDDLRFWAHLDRWVWDLLARGKFLPALAENQALWEPLLDSSRDRERLQHFCQHMPGVCAAECRDLAPQATVLDFVTAALNWRARQQAPRKLPPLKTAAVKPWLQALTLPTGELSDELAASELARLQRVWERWAAPVRDRLARELQGQPEDARACLWLQPPTAGKETWMLTFGLQLVDAPGAFLPAATIWQQAGEALQWSDRPIRHPQEILLRGLGLAAGVCEPVAACLECEAAPTHCELDAIAAYEFVRARTADLRERGLGVVVPPGLDAGLRESRLGLKVTATAPPDRRLSLQSALTLQWELAVGDRELSPEAFAALLAQRSPLVEIEGEWLALQPADVRAAQKLLDGTGGDLAELTVADALRLQAGEGAGLAKLPVVKFEAAGALKELFANFSENQEFAEVEAPPGLRATLRPYQLRGVSWLAFQERWGLGACLADDMGLGKTIQTISLLLHLKAQKALKGPTLLVCPTSVLGNWEKEVHRFAPTLSIAVHHGDKRLKGKAFGQDAKKRDLIATSYALAQRDAKLLQGISWRGLILDEAQNIKNPQAKQTKAIRAIAAEFRLALTGTPIENRLAELWSILEFLNPGYLGTLQFFQRRFATPIEKYGDRDTLQKLRSLVRPFILRRLKTDKNILQDLPEKQEATIYCGLSGEQADTYQQLVDAAMTKIDAAEGIQRRGQILALLTKLKQLCNHPALLAKENRLDPGRSGKLLRLSEMVEELVAEGDRALIFTQFAEWGKLLKPYLEKRLGREVPFLYGATRRQQREEMVARFQDDPDGPYVFILSIKAGGTGLNLTRANHVFHIDRWWNPAVENQATDRAFRIGQKRNVQVHKFVCSGTLEERIAELLESKKQLAEQTVSAGEDWLLDLDTEQLRSLVALDRTAVIDDE